ncbi:MAG: zinc-ribbon domain-containing protein [Candidatus Limnocylindria bacterium]
MTEASVCRRCGTANPPGISFCANCGQRLVAADEATMSRPGSVADSAPCPRCGASNRAGSAFCSECGFNIRLAVTPTTGPVAAPAPEEGRVPLPAEAAPSTDRPASAWLGPLVLAIAAVGLGTAWFLPFSQAEGSLADQAFGAAGYGLAFWTAYPTDAGLLQSTYFGVAAPLPILVALLLVLAGVGILRGMPGRPQRIGLWIALVWCVLLAILFVVVEIGSGLGDDLIGLLRGLSPAGLIGCLAGIIGAIGSVTRMAGG